MGKQQLLLLSVSQQPTNHGWLLILVICSYDESIITAARTGLFRVKGAVLALQQHLQEAALGSVRVGCGTTRVIQQYRIRAVHSVQCNTAAASGCRGEAERAAAEAPGQTAAGQDGSAALRQGSTADSKNCFLPVVAISLSLT
jgi:hypothetical protein